MGLVTWLRGKKKSKGKLTVAETKLPFDVRSDGTRQFRSPQRTTPTPAPTPCCFYWMSCNEGSSQGWGSAVRAFKMTTDYSTNTLGLENPGKILEGAPCMCFQSFVIALFVIRCLKSLWSRFLDRVGSSAGVPHGHYLTLLNTKHVVSKYHARQHRSSHVMH